MDRSPRDAPPLPPPWTIEEANNACLIVRDNTGQANRFGGGQSDAPSFRGKLVGHCKPSRYERDGAPYKRSSYGNLAFNMRSFIQDKVQ